MQSPEESFSFNIPNIPSTHGLNPKRLAQGAEVYTGYVSGGWGISSFPAFQGTPYEVHIPIRRRYPRQEVLDEVNSINSETLGSEPFQEYFRHVDMLLTFDAREIIEENIQTILTRSRNEGVEFSKAVYSSNGPEHQNYLQEHILLRTMACLDECLKNPSFRLPKESVEQLLKDGKELRGEFLPYALILDNRNKMHGTSIDVGGHLIEDLVPLILEGETRKKDLYLFETAYVNVQFFSVFLTRSLLRATTPEQCIYIANLFSSGLGLDNMRKILREYTTDNPSFKPKFDIVFNYLGIDPVDAKTDLVRDIYEKIDFSEYPPNKEMQEFEIDLLKKELKGRKSLLDMACGTGRHLLELDGHEGMVVSGIDLVPKHIEYIKQKSPESDVRVGSWFHTEYADKTFKGGWVLGRSLTHNTTVGDMINCLTELKRIMEDDAVVIVDMPDPSKGEYKELIEKTRKVAEQKHMYILPGMINDSPNQELFYDRYAPTPEAFSSIALLAGWAAEDLPETQTYRSSNGMENTNVYWRLRKLNGSKVVYKGDAELHRIIYGQKPY